METLKVGTKSNPNSVAGALANVMREKGTVEIQAIGAGALMIRISLNCNFHVLISICRTECFS